MVLQEVHLYTEVQLPRFFPRQFGVSNLVFNHHLRVNGLRSFTEIILVEVFVFCIAIRRGQIKEAVATNLVVTHFAIGGPKLQEHHVIVLWKERLFTDYPTRRHCGEETKAPSLGEVFCAVVTHIKLGQITRSIFVGEPTHQTLVGIGHQILQIGRIILALVVKQQGRSVVFAKALVVVQTQFGVYLAVLSIVGRGCPHRFFLLRNEYHATSSIRVALGRIIMNALAELLTTVIIAVERYASMYRETLEQPSA